MRTERGTRKSGTDWEARYHSDREPEVKVLVKAFAGIPSGARMLVVTPRAVDAVVADIPSGTVVSADALRRTLAQRYGAEYACPVTTGISLRVVAERAFIRLQNGENDVTPFWRAIAPNSPLASKLACGIEFLEQKRNAEVE